MKTISVPKTEEAQTLLDYDECPNELLLEIQLSQEEFDILWHAKFFAVINSTCDALIDDYESEEITDLRNIELAIIKIRGISWPENSVYLVEKVLDLFVKAKELKTVNILDRKRIRLKEYLRYLSTLDE